MPEVAIRTEGLSYTYQGSDTAALKGIDLSISHGEITAILGRNGSGKTTLVRHFNGLLRPTSGRVFLFGSDTATRSVAELSQICGYVFQNPNHQIFCATVYEELAVGPSNFGFDATHTKEAIEQTAAELGLTEVLEKHPMTLDYTTKKLVAIASVLVSRPKILVLDEPTDGLDEIGREKLSCVIDDYHRQAHTIVLISHDMDYVANISSRIIVMDQGCISCDASPRQVFSDRKALQAARLAPPQITELDLWLSAGRDIALTTDEFVAKHQGAIPETS